MAPAASTPRLFLAGVVTGCTGAATSAACAWALGASTSPVAAVAASVRDLTPGPLAVHLVDLVGHLDKPLLLAGTTIVMLALCGLAGVLAGVRRWRGQLLLLALGLLGLWATSAQHHADAAAVLSVLVGLVTWLVVLPALVADRTDVKADRGRRVFLLRAGVGIGASAAVVALGRWAGQDSRAVTQARRMLRLPVSSGMVPAGADLGVRGVPQWRTPSRVFYRVDTQLSPPSIDPSKWRLRIHGMVDHEVQVDFRDLLDRRLHQAWVTLCCVSNPVGGDLVGNAWWSGVPVRQLLAEAGVHPGADAVKQTSWDGWTCGTPLSALTDGRNALLAVAMNGMPLPVEHGFPVRMVVPGLYGYVSATKWLVDLEVTRFDRFQGYWTRAGWSPRGPVKTQSRVDVPRDGQQVRAGSVAVGGVAWAQHTGIEKVEYQLDGRPWRRARLGRVPDVDTWVQWSGEVRVDPGSHVLAVRATDRSGYTQTAVQRGVLPDGATGWHTVRFVATSGS
ncbi:MAG: molybdopterin-dependent oxidoreductase [Marmoricola sp.]